MNKHQIISLLCLLLVCVKATSQAPVDFISSNYHAYYFNPQNLGISLPQVADFVRFGNPTVDHYNGLLNMEISLDGYKDNDFELPMSIKYLSSGFIPSKRPSIVGYNWILNFGGIISRTVKGSPDDTKGNYANKDREYIKDGLLVAIRNNTFTAYSEQQLVDFNVDIVSNNKVPYTWGDFKYDMEPDIFNFSFGGHSGSFIIGNQGTPVSLTGEGYKIDISGLAIQSYSTQSAPIASQIKITTPDGYLYTFGGNTTFLEYFIPNNPDKLAIRPRHIISWCLKSIEAPNGRKVEFTYESKETASHYNYFLYSHYQIAQAHTTCSPSLSTSKVSKQITVEDKIYSPLINIVTIGDVKIQFQMTQGNSFFNDTDYSYHLSDIAFYYGTSKKKEISFNYLHKGKYIFLDKMTMNGQVYKFEYNLTRTLPAPLTSSLDHWGFWNGEYTTDVSNVENYCQNADSLKKTNAGYHSVGLLTKITYPAGGYSDISYEQNSYNRYMVKDLDVKRIELQSTPNDILCGGARVSKVSDYDPINSKYSSVKTYYYLNPDTGEGSGVIGIKPKYKALDLISATSAHGFFLPSGELKSCGISFLFAYEDISINTLGFNENLPEYHIGYSDVIERLEDNGYIHYKYTSSDDILNTIDGMNYSIVYTPISHRDNDEPLLTSLQIAEKSGLYKTNDLSHFRGKIKSKTTFNTANDTVQAEQYTYNLDEATNTYQISVASASRGKAAYRVYTTPCLLTKKEVVDGNGFTHTESYQYNNKSVIAEQQTMNSNEDYWAIQYEYPSDYPSPSTLTAAERLLLTRNILTKPMKITKKNLSKNRVLESLRFTYRVENSKPVLSDVRKQRGNDWNKIMEYPVYDSYGNPAHTIEYESLHTVYLWGYQGQRLTSKVINASYSDVSSCLGKYGITFEQLAERAFTDSQEDKFFLDMIRNEFSPQTQMTVYIHEPLVGIKSVINPRGIKTNYTYDSSGRLQSCGFEDMEGKKNILEFYKYRYTNQ